MLRIASYLLILMSLHSVLKKEKWPNKKIYPIFGYTFFEFLKCAVNLEGNLISKST